MNFNRMNKYRKIPVEVEAIQFTDKTKDRVYNWAKSIQGNVFHDWDDFGSASLFVPKIEDFVQRGFDGIALVVNDRSFTLESSSFPDWLPEQLEMISAYLTDPGFRDELDVKLPSVVANVYSDQEASPIAAISQGLREALAPGGVRSMPPREQMAGLRSRDFEALLKPVVTAAPLEVTLVGDLDEKTAVRSGRRP